MHCIIARHTDALLLHHSCLQAQAEWRDVQQAAQQRSDRGLAAWQALGGQLLGNDLHEVRLWSLKTTGFELQQP
jgi:hypothetical protein